MTRQSLFGKALYPVRLLIKIIIWTILSLILLAFIVPPFIPIERIIPIPKIHQAILEQTGLKVSLQGKTRLSILPFLGVKAYNVQLTNEQFSESNVLKAQEIDIKISALPILAGKVIVKNINIDNAHINIIKCNNKFNFFSPLITKKHTDSTAQINKNKDIQKKEPAMLYIRDASLTNVSILNSSVSYTDCKSDIVYNVNAFSANVSLPDFKSPVNAQIKFLLNKQSFDIALKSSNINDIITKQSGEGHIVVKSDLGNINLSANYNINKKNPTFFDSASIKIKVTEASIQNALKNFTSNSKNINELPQKIDFDTIIEVDNENIKIIDATVKTENASISTKGTDITIHKSLSVDNISANGNVTITISDIQNLLTKLNISIPAIKKYPSLISSPLYFTFEKGILSFNKESILKIDNTIINFYAIIDMLSNKKLVTAKIKSQFINIDDYINFITTTNANIVTPNANKGIQVKNNSQNLLSNLSKESITLFEGQNMEIDIQTDIQKLIVNNITVEEISSSTKIENQTIHNITHLNIFDGKIESNLQAQEDNAILKALKLNLNIKNIATHNLISTFKLPPVVQGRINTDLTFSSQGASLYDIALKGRGVLNIDSKNLIIKGVDINAAIRDLKTNYKKILTNGGIAKYISTTKSSTIDTMIFKAQLKHGILKNSQFLTKKNDITINGNGKLNLLNTDIQYYIHLLNGNKPLPTILLKGKLDNISYSFDVKELIKHQAHKSANKIIEQPDIQKKIEKFGNIVKSFAQ